MEANISLKRAVQSMILFLMAAAVALIWPLKLIRPWQCIGEINPDSDRIVQGEGTIMQEFVPEMYGLSSISFYIYNEDMREMEDGALVFRLFDENMYTISEKRISLDTLSVPGVCRIRMGDMQVGARYYFTLESENAELLFSMSDGVHLDVRYDYKTLFTKGQYALCALAILVAGALLAVLAEFTLRGVTKRVRFDFGIRLAFSIPVVGISLWGLWKVFLQKAFSDKPLDIFFYSAGILLFLAFSLYGLLFKRDASADGKLSWNDIKSRIPGLLQSAAFAGVILGGVKYLNALSSYHQKLGSNIALSCFALAIICGYAKREVFNWYNLVYLLPAVGVGIYYVQQNKGDIEHWDVYKGNAVYYILWGIVLLNTVRMLIKDKRSKVSKVYLLALALLVAEMVRSRNGRIWPVDVAVFWGLFAVRVIYKGNIQKYLRYFSNGVFLHFIGSSIYAVLYRPFHYYIYTRYPGIFHTVTMTAVYLVLVLVLATIRFLFVYREKKCLKKAWKELGIMGMAEAFLLLTVSRTGLISALILCLLILIVTAFSEYKDGLSGLVKRTGIFVVTGAVFFVMIFTACRIVPAVVSKPFTYEIEWFIGSIKAGEEWDSPWFITVARFLGYTEERLQYGGEQERKEEPADTDNAQAPQTEAGGTASFLEEPAIDYSNGRLEIFRLYLKQLDWKGHKTVSIADENGRELGHAHNVFIQVAHDFGMGAGIYFIIFCIFAGIRAIYYYVRHRGEDTGLVPVGILGIFGICGLVEWVFIPYIPTGFAFLTVLVLLIPAEKKESEEI